MRARIHAKHSKGSLQLHALALMGTRRFHASMARGYHRSTTNTPAGNIPAAAHTFARADPARLPFHDALRLAHAHPRRQIEEALPASTTTAPYTPFHVGAAAAAPPARGTCTHRLESQLCRHPPPKRRSSRPGYRLGPSRNDGGSRRNVLAEPGVDVDQDTCPCVSLPRSRSRFSPSTSPGSDALYAPGNATPLGLLVPLPVTVSW
jgi:hypothetical protein